MINRLENFAKMLPSYEADRYIDAALIVSPVNRFYLSGFKSSKGIVFVTRDISYFIVDFRYYESACSLIKNMEVVMSSDFKSEILNIIKKHKIKNILLENDGITLAEVLKFEEWFKDDDIFFVKTKKLDDIIYSFREIKTDEEIKNIQTAQEIAERAFNKLLSTLKLGMSEKEIAFNLEFLMKKEGADGISFELIVASGKNSAIPHATPSDKPIKDGDFITIDMGATYKGYCSDMTRTVALGKVSEKQLSVYNTVLKAQTQAISMIKPDALCKKIDDIARKIISENGYEGCFKHALGHGVGIQVHENPVLSVHSEAILKPGMIVTIEPGIYLKNEFGVRIEDMILVTESGYKNLTSLNKDLIIL